MTDLLSITWYAESPIDLEYKEYILLAYLQKVDKSFNDKVLSPHLLHMEKMIDDMHSFASSFNKIKKDFDKNRYVYFDNVKIQGEDNTVICEIKELVEFAIPQIEPRIGYGYKILKRKNQVLF